MRSEREAALLDLLVAVEECAHRAEHGATLIEQGALSEAMTERCRALSATADDLRDGLRGIGQLPKEPDADRLTIADGIRSIRAAIGSDAAAAVLDDLIAAEQAIVAGARAAAGAEGDDGLDDLIERSAQAARAAIAFYEAQHRR